ncbi:MAG: polysaccharide biosynthesis protein [Spirochaetales bacterium]|nr:polysaccharide biosynthesis protein [Spirochaetales bacterium]
MVDKKVAIAGTGEKAYELADEITKKKIFGDFNGFIAIEDFPVYGECRPVISRIVDGALISPLSVDEVIISLPLELVDLTGEVFEALQKAKIPSIKVLPPLSSLIDNKAHIIQTREIEPEDILERKPVSLNLEKSIEYLKGERVLITGAGGSIGSEIARQLLKGGAERLYLFDHNEDSLYQIEKELRILQSEGIGSNAVIVPILGDLKDKSYVFYILKRLHADVIFHCAAFKHVPIAENNPIAVIENNVFATRNLLEASSQYELNRFVLISTDKAVEPSGLYGCSKKICEDLVLKFCSGNSCKYMVVRFGNVLGSRGSIIPLFKEQIRKGGPLTVTHREASRYFMTIPEAVSLVIKTGGLGENHQTYILDMGEPVNIRDLAIKMIRFSGYEADRDIKIEYTGLRKGEKLSERLYDTEDAIIRTPDKDIYLLERHKQALDTDQLLAQLSPIVYYSSNDEELYRNRKELYKIINRYIPSLDANL